MSADVRCTGTPISWLKLELHSAGGLTTADERDEIAAHLATCDACAACLARIEADAVVPLPALARVSPHRRPISILRRIAAPVAAVAVAAGVLLALGRGPRSDGQGHSADLGLGAARTKGGDVTFVLVRDDESVVAEAGGVFGDGDRWKALVTCPAGMRASWDLVVFEAGDVQFPLAAPADLTCGNDVPLTGAFRTTGHEAMTVCLVWDDGTMVDRDALRHTTPDALGHSSCKRLSPRP